jgi:hypothetical protein
MTDGKYFFKIRIDLNIDHNLGIDFNPFAMDIFGGMGK